MSTLRELFESQYLGIDSIYQNIVLPVFYNEENYKDFFYDLRKADKKIEISESDKKQIEKIKFIARFGGGFPLVFVDVEVKDSVHLVRSRVSIQNCVRKIIDSYTNAIIFFHDKDNKNEWRVSFVQKGATLSDATNAKRFTYICGKNASCRTITQRFEELKKIEFWNDEDLKEAFAVQSVSEDFFAGYKVFYEDFVQFITGNRYLKKGSKWEKTKIHEPNAVFEKFIQLAKKEMFCYSETQSCYSETQSCHSETQSCHSETQSCHSELVSESQKKTLKQVQGDVSDEIILLAQKKSTRLHKKNDGSFSLFAVLAKKRLAWCRTKCKMGNRR